MGTPDRRGRKADRPVDRTRFEDSTVDVEARSGFLLRHNREYGANADLATGTAMVRALREFGVGASPAEVSNWERGAVAAPGRVIEAYEVLTGAAPGSLRGIVETMRRCYGAVRVAQRRRDQVVLGLDEVTSRCQVVFEGTPRGVDWLRFADLLGDERVTLPAFLVVEPFTRLVSEMCRSISVAYLTRYEAVASVLAGPYAPQARRAVLDAIRDEHAQVVMDPIVALSESPDPEVLGWLVGLLRDRRPNIARGAVYAIDNALVTGRVDDETVALIASAVVEAYPVLDERTRLASASVIRMLPRDRVASLLDRVGDSAPANLGNLRTPEERAPLLEIAEAMHDEVNRLREHSGTEPLLSRLIYEAVFEERATRRFHALSMLKAVPYYTTIAEVNATVAREHEELLVRQLATEALLHFGQAPSADTVVELVTSADPDRCRGGLVACAHQGIMLPAELLEPLLDPEKPVWNTAFYAAGMTGHALIDRFAEDPAADRRLRGAAQWWRREGTAVRDQ